MCTYNPSRRLSCLTTLPVYSLTRTSNTAKEAEPEEDLNAETIRDELIAGFHEERKQLHKVIELQKRKIRTLEAIVEHRQSKKMKDDEEVGEEEELYDDDE